jgi:hypothetical protein
MSVKGVNDNGSGNGVARGDSDPADLGTMEDILPQTRQQIYVMGAGGGGRSGSTSAAALGRRLLQLRAAADVAPRCRYCRIADLPSGAMLRWHLDEPEQSERVAPRCSTRARRLVLPVLY